MTNSITYRQFVCKVENMLKLVIATSRPLLWY